MQTPASRTVRWDLDDALSALNSPASNTSTEFASTSSLQYINSQLVAHGFTAAPGLSLDGVASADMEKAVKCLLAMLSQRVEDMARTETLSTKLRTLTYDHERLKSMHGAAEERAASAEREMHTYKSRLANAQKALQTSEAAHKHTTTELQRTRSSLQTLRTLHQTELKKKDKEIDRMADRWAKLADAQARLSAAPSGLRCANGGSVDAGMPAADSQTFLESALEESERARMEIVEECKYVKQLVLNAVGGMREVAGAKGDTTLAALFPISPAHAAKDAIVDTLAALRATIARLSPSDDSSESPSSSTLKPPAAGPKPTVTTSHPPPTSATPVPAIAEPIPATTNSAPADIARLQETIKALRTEIEGARSAGTAESHAAEAAVNHIAAEMPKSNVAEGRRRTRAAKGHTQKTPTSEPEREASPVGRQTHRNDDRKRATHAALEDVPREKDELEEPQIQDEEMPEDDNMSILAHVPEEEDVSMAYRSPAKVHTMGHGSPRKVSGPHKVGSGLHRGSPRKVSAHKLLKTASPRKVSKGSPRKVSKPKRGLMPSSRVEPAYETEVLPHTAGGMMDVDLDEGADEGSAGGNEKPASSQRKPASSDGKPSPASAKLATDKPAGLLPTFVLPPPSPRTSLPPQPALPPMAFPPLNLPSLSAAPTPSAPIAAAPPLSALPRTPPRGYPVAKPHAARMIHAYSPAQPSPLSRILMLGNSPGSSDGGRKPLSALDPLREEDERMAEEGEEEADRMRLEDDDENPFSPIVVGRPMSLAEELGVTLSPPSPPAPVPARDTKGKGRAVAPPLAPAALAGSKRPLDKENAGGKAAKKKRESRKEKESEKGAGPTARAKSSAPTSKTGRETRSSSSKAAPAGSSRAGSSRETRSKPSSPPRLRVTGAGGGPRRVPIDSAEAPKLRPRKA